MKPTFLHESKHAVVVYHHSPEFGVPFEDLLRPEYWSHVAAKLRPGYRVEVMAADGSYWGMLLCRAASRTEAIMAPLQFKEIAGAVEIENAEVPYMAKWRGPTAKWSVVRKADKTVVKDSFQVREHAENWIKNALKAVAA